MTVEELQAMGFSKEDAEALVKAQGGGGGAGLPFPTLKINYDTKDVLSDFGVKKGEFIAGWKIDSSTLSVKEEGEVLKQPLEFFVVASAYQKSHFDTASKSTTHATDIYFDPFSTKTQIDRKTGKTVEQVEKEMGSKLKFNNILLLMVKVGKEWKPYIHYMHGTNYYKWGEQLAEKGIDRNNMTLKYLFKVKSKKIPTDYNPAWIMEIVDVKERSMADIGGTASETAAAIQKFNKWVASVNNGGTGAVSEEETDRADHSDKSDSPFDINEDEEIDFD